MWFWVLAIKRDAGEKSEFIAAGARNVVVTTDDGSYGIAGYASDGVKKLLADTSYRCMYVCGPEPMMASVCTDFS